mmetsp:Transcript_6804/g.5954  ORF Transcript_6804/g.5954 Transcript_6804/m.5954 type:complete len:223 (+) Transcript_6804:253-921(+)
MPPELHKREDLEANAALDIWATGVLLFMMIYGFHPFKVKNRAQTIKNIISKDIPFDNEVEVTKECKDLISQMLEKDPKKRINMLSILNHKWFEMTETEISLSKVVSVTRSRDQVVFSSEEIKRDKMSFGKQSISGLPQDNMKLTSYSKNEIRKTSNEIEIEQAKKIAYERFNEKVFLLNSAGRPKAKKRVDILKILNKVENKSKRKRFSKSKNKNNKYRSLG